MSLDKAPKYIKLAVDLIDILETNEVDSETAIQALEIVLRDFKKRQATKALETSAEKKPQ
ncbi:YbaM family protein [Marinomonas sp. 2405UD68-3]|uniref:YbaM family protein n=1 Tax=Marinomonas sp. 2405UD68-3 TaxID=3391835 RepID=UPI0039C9D203